MTNRASWAATAVLLAANVLTVSAEAATITYGATNISGNTWAYDYAVTNDSLGSALFEFTVYFDPT